MTKKLKNLYHLTAICSILYPIEKSPCAILHKGEKRENTEVQYWMKLLLPEDKLVQFNMGQAQYSYRYMGAHLVEMDGVKGVRFAVWAPDVKSVQVIGDFNEWREDANWLEPQASTGVWAGFLPGVKEGALYKYLIVTEAREKLYKADPYAFSSELRPGTASRVVELRGYHWKDEAWMARRAKTDHFKRPMNIYEVHLGSWRQHDVPRVSEQDVPPGAF